MKSHDIEHAMKLAYQQYKHNQSGANASYIPALAGVDSELFAIAAVTLEGDVITIGDAQRHFAIESISKAFNLSLAMDDWGAKELRAKVGSEATGEGFNSVMALELHKGRPMSPLVNAGAISTVSLVKASSADERWDRMSQRFESLCGQPLALMEEVYSSESDNNEHNRGISWLLKSYGYMYSDTEDALDLYTRMCSFGVTTRDLAMMASCYASGGANPLTRQQVVHASNVPEILADMVMEGLYTGSGSWLYDNGLPAKSGVGGGVICVVPGVMGLAAFSPKLDSSGNSIRARLALTEMIAHLRLNPLVTRWKEL